MAKLFAGLDVSDRTTKVCVVDRNGVIIWEGSAETEPKALMLALKPYKALLSIIGLEAGAKSAWIRKSLQAKRFHVVCLETRHTHAALSARRNKSDRSDAHGIALMMCQGIFKTAYTKSEEALQTRMLLTNRKVLQRKAHDLHVTLRMTLKQFGVSVRKQGGGLVISDKDKKPNRTLLSLAKPIVRMHAALNTEFLALDEMVKRKAKADPVCKRLMTVPGIGPITALTFRAAVDDPSRFSSSRNVAAHFGLTPRRFQSGEIDVAGHISKRGDKTVRMMLYEAALTLIVASRSNARLRVWAVALAKRKGNKLAAVATARKLAVVMHRMWVTARDFEANPAMR
jgi:transposase